MGGAEAERIVGEIETDSRMEKDTGDPVAKFREYLGNIVGVEDALNIRGGHGVLTFLDVSRSGSAGRNPFVLRDAAERAE